LVHKKIKILKTSLINFKNIFFKILTKGYCSGLDEQYWIGWPHVTEGGNLQQEAMKEIQLFTFPYFPIVRYY
jgi:hypothetical protein